MASRLDTFYRHRGPEWVTATMTVRAIPQDPQKEDCETRTSQVAGSNSWYVAGNHAFAGLIDWFIMDPLSGGKYTLSSDN